VFDKFRAPFERAGHTVIAVDLPGHEAGARRGAVTGLSMSDYARAVAATCEGLGEPADPDRPLPGRLGGPASPPPARRSTR